MSDEGNAGEFDPCACMFNHDLAMQRLLSILRQSQAYCSDSECLSLTRLPGPQGGTPNNNDFFMLFVITIIGMVLYALRPNSLRQPESAKSINDDDFDGEPPIPPPGVN